MKIVCKVQSGLCNRLIPFITTYCLSLESNSEYYLYWDDNCMDLDYKYKGEKTKYEDMFEYIEDINYINLEQFNEFLKKDNNTLIININNNFSYTLDDLKNFELIIFNDYYYPVYLKKDNIKFKSYTDNFNLDYKWITKISNIFLKLKLKKYINDKVLPFDNKDIVGLHIRHWPIKWMKDQNINKNDYLKNLFKAIYDEINKNKQVKFFVSTSNKDVLLKIKDIFKDRIIYFKERFGHPNIDFFYNNDSSIDYCTFNKNINGLVDLVLLSKCSKIYCQKSSSFSFCAHLMNKNSELVLLDR